MLNKKGSVSLIPPWLKSESFYTLFYRNNNKNIEASKFQKECIFEVNRKKKWE